MLAEATSPAIPRSFIETGAIVACFYWRGGMAAEWGTNGEHRVKTWVFEAFGAKKCTPK